MAGFEKTVDALKGLLAANVIDSGDMDKAIRELTIIDALFWPVITDLKTDNPAVIAPVLTRLLDRLG